MLITEYLPQHKAYVVTPVENGRPSKEVQYIFPSEHRQMEFITAYFRNPLAAMYAYHLKIEQYWLAENSEVFLHA